MRHEDFDAHMRGFRARAMRPATKREFFRIEYLALVPIIAILLFTVLVFGG